MASVHDVLKTAHKNTVDASMSLMYMKEQHVPGSLQYTIRRYVPQQKFNNDDAGMLVYNYNAATPDENFLELRFA